MCIVYGCDAMPVHSNACVIILYNIVGGFSNNWTVSRFRISVIFFSLLIYVSFHLTLALFFLFVYSFPTARPSVVISLHEFFSIMFLLFKNKRAGFHVFLGNHQGTPISLQRIIKKYFNLESSRRFLLVFP